MINSILNESNDIHECGKYAKLLYVGPSMPKMC